MSKITIVTFINAPPERCFDLSRSIELHMISTSHTQETAIAGRTSGLCTEGDTVTWRAKHFGIFQKLSVKINKCCSPSYFEDEMVRGAFKSFNHQHFFEASGSGTLMKDVFRYEVPFGIAGKIFDLFVLNRYMRKLLKGRNETIRRFAESDQWKKLLLHPD